MRKLLPNMPKAMSSINSNKAKQKTLVLEISHSFFPYVQFLIHKDRKLHQAELSHLRVHKIHPGVCPLPPLSVCFEPQASIVGVQIFPLIPDSLLPSHHFIITQRLKPSWCLLPPANLRPFPKPSTLSIRVLMGLLFN